MEKITTKNITYWTSWGKSGKHISFWADFPLDRQSSLPQAAEAEQRTEKADKKPVARSTALQTKKAN